MGAAGTTETAPCLKDKAQTALPWMVVLLNDPVNLVEYVTWALTKVFGYSKARSLEMVLEVHRRGRGVVWSGEREPAELFTQQLQGLQLTALLEQST